MAVNTAQFTGPSMGGVDFTKIVAGTADAVFTATVAADGFKPSLNHKAGERSSGDGASEFIFVKAAAAISQYDCVHVDETFNAQPITSTLALTYKIIGFAQVAFSQYDIGWVAVKGTGLGVNVLSACNSGQWLCTSATAGKLDDTYTTFVPLTGVSIATTIAATGVATLITNGEVKPQLRTSGV